MNEADSPTAIVISSLLFPWSHSASRCIHLIPPSDAVNVLEAAHYIGLIVPAILCNHHYHSVKVGPLHACCIKLTGQDAPTRNGHLLTVKHRIGMLQRLQGHHYFYWFSCL